MVAQATHECCVAATLLAAGLALLFYADARAFRTLQALAASLAVSSGYAQTARRAATGVGVPFEPSFAKLSWSLSPSAMRRPPAAPP